MLKQNWQANKVRCNTVTILFFCENKFFKSLIKMKKNKNKKAYTLIEILIIVAIIALLASVVLISLISAKDKAKDADFKSVISSINSSLMMCCFNEGQILSSIDGNICNPADMGAKYPDSTKIGIINISYPAGGVCSGTSGSYTVKILPGVKNKGKCTSATLDQTGNILFEGC